MSSAPGKNDVCRGWSWNVLGAAEAELGQVDSTQEMLARAEQDRRDGKMHLVNQPCAQILPGRGHPAADTDVEVTRSFGGAFQCVMDAAGDEVEGCSAIHFERRARVAGEHEHGAMVGRIVSPPSPPGVVQPRSPNRSEHVTAYD